jgi:hypothetical protein
MHAYEFDSILGSRRRAQRALGRAGALGVRKLVRSIDHTAQGRQ